ncbi:hypothetical protein ACFL4Q_00715 [candidate division KSB1 bacterium]
MSITIPAAAQQNPVDIYGYFEPQITGFIVNDRFMQMGSNKLRIDLETAVSDRITFKANFDYITYHGNRTFCYMDFVIPDISSPVPDALKEFYSLRFEDETFLDNAYLMIAFDRFDLTIGKQQVSPGTGYAWNPTDLFNIKNVIDPTYEQSGNNGVRIDLPLNYRNSLMLFYSPEEDFTRSGKYARFKTRIGHFDLSLIGGERQWPLSNYYTLVSQYERRRTVGADIAGEVLGIGVWCEAAQNNKELSENYFEGVFGIDYTFENQLYLLSEYYRNDQGKSDYRTFDLTDWMRSFTAETKSIARDQWYLFSSFPATDLLTAGASVIGSLNDRSFAFVPTVIYNLDNNLDVTLFFNIYAGSKGKTYSSQLGNGGLLRARYYF